MLTESMVPAINPGDLMHVDCSVPFDELHVGDVVQFQSVDGATSHRIIGIQDDALITMGNNNPDQDYPVPREKYLGRVANVLGVGLFGFIIVPASAICVPAAYVGIRKLWGVARARMQSQE